MKILLTNPTLNDENEIKEFVDEYNDLPEIYGVDRFEGVNDFSNIVDFKEWILKVERFKDRESVPAHLEPQTLYLAKDSSSGMIVGAITIRHSLNENLLRRGGHIGYGIRSTLRRKGYGSEMLRQALDKCKSMGICKVLITCSKNNTGSSKVIQNNGGVLESEMWDQEEGCTYLRYWIEL